MFTWAVKLFTDFSGQNPYNGDQWDGYMVATIL